MSWLNRLRNTLWREIDKELPLSIAERVDELVASGMARPEALALVLRQFGTRAASVEQTHKAGILVWLESLLQDVRFACRMLSRAPAFSIVAVASLAAGIGSSAAMFSFADLLLLKPLPVPRPTEVFTVGTTFTDERFGPVSYRDYLDYRDGATSFAGLTAFAPATFAIVRAPDAQAIVKAGLIVAGNFFRVLDVEPSIGRGFLPDEDQVPGRNAVVVLSHAFWVSDFGAAPTVIGGRIRINGVNFTVIGVAPAAFTGTDQLSRPALFVPAKMWPSVAPSTGRDLLESRKQRVLTVKGRLRPGVARTQAEAELASIASRLERAFPDTNRKRGIRVLSEFKSRLERSPVESTLSTLLGVLAAAVLLVACANVAGLLLSRSTVRAREIALRTALGSGRVRLVRQLITENLLIALAGGVLGCAVAYAGIAFLSRIDFSTDVRLVSSVRLDQRVLLFSLTVSLLSTALFGLAPALSSTRVDLAGALKDAPSGGVGPHRMVGRRLIVVAQVAASLVLLTIATVVYLGFRKPLAGENRGFRTDRLLLMTFEPALTGLDAAGVERFYRQLIDRARQTPGVKSAALTAAIPMDDDQDALSIVPEGYELPRGKDGVSVLSSTVDPGYFETMEIRLLKGRGFLDADKEATRRVAVVNQEFANHYWPGRDAVGRRFRLGGAAGPWTEVVGVVQTGKYTWIAEAPTEYIYLPLNQNPKQRITMITESIGNDPASLVRPLREMIRGIDAGQPAYNVRTMDSFYRKHVVGTPTVILQTIGGLGLLGLALSMVGLFGLVAYSVSRRTREIGIRMAIGSSRQAVLRMVLREGLMLGAAGVAAGLGVSYAAEKILIASFSDTATDALVYLLLPPLLLATILLASFAPARRASRVDPLVALRYE